MNWTFYTNIISIVRLLSPSLLTTGTIKVKSKEKLNQGTRAISDINIETLKFVLKIELSVISVPK